MNEQTHARQALLRQNRPLILLGFIILFAALSILLFQIAKSRLFESARDAYDNASTNTYNTEYNKFVDKGENAYHVKNRAQITVGPALETSNLEVLTVCATVLVNNDKKDIFEEITGYSSFSTNLKAAEYMIDEERQIVYIRLPEPRLMEPIALDENSIHKYSFSSDSFLTGSIQSGEKQAEGMRRDASAQILSKLKYDSLYLDEAKKSADSIISALVHELNPTVDNLKVIIDFY